VQLLRNYVIGFIECKVFNVSCQITENSLVFSYGGLKMTDVKDPLSLGTLKEEVEKLVVQVKKNTNAIIDTGNQILDIQLDKERARLERDLPTTGQLERTGKHSETLSQSEKDEDAEETQVSGTLTYDDLVELVTELQGQLDMLDERSIRRTANAFVSDDSDVIAPLPGRDGEIPTEEEGFPRNLRQFKDLDFSQVEQWLRLYELLPPNEEELNEILDRVGAKLEDLGAIPAEKKPSNCYEADLNFDNLARFLGLRIRRTKDAW
jgi:hypothetical protein